MRARDGWTIAFLVLIFAAPALRLVSSEKQLVTHELITVSGLLTVAFLAAAIIVPTRLRSVTRSFGIESVLLTHRFLGTATALAGLAHLGLIVAVDPDRVSLLVPMNGELPPLRAVMGTLSLISVVVLVLLAIYRRGRYQVWRGWHLMLTWFAALAAGAHVVLLNHLLRLDSPDVATAAFLALLALLVTGLEIWRWAIRPLLGQGAYRVTEVRPVSDSVSVVRVRPRRRGQTPRFQPGQFAWIRFRRAPLFSEEHPFTVSSGVQDRPTIEFTIRHAGDWTTRLRTLRAGDELWLDGPHGSFTTDLNTRDGIVLIAGGVGLTPMMAMLRSMMAHPPDPSFRSVRLILVDRPGQGLFREELAAMRSRLGLQIFELGFTALTAEVLVDCLPQQFLRTRLDYYLCGRPTMVSEGTQALHELGVRSSRIHTERFAI